MANLSKGYSFGATETVTATKLHNLVDLGSVSGIVNADIAAGANIDATKLDLTSAGYTTSGGNFDITGLWNLNNVGGMKLASIASIAQARVSNLYGVNSFDTNLVVSSIASIASIRVASLAMPSVTVVDIKDEDDMASDSATALATQQSVKSYVDTSLAAIESVDLFTAGSSTVGTADTLRSTTSATYVKLKELTPLVRGGVINVYWTYSTVSGGVTAYSKVYVNDIAVGAEKTTVTNNVAASELNVSVNVGDKVQIYGHCNGTHTMNVESLTIKVANPWNSVEVSGY